MKIRLCDYWNEKNYYLGTVEVANVEEAKHLVDFVNALEDETYCWEEIDNPTSYSNAIRELERHIPDRIVQLEEEKQHNERCLSATSKDDDYTRCLYRHRIKKCAEDIEFLTNIMKGEQE